MHNSHISCTFAAMIEYLRLLRPLQWLKNGFVFAPIFFSSNLLKWEFFWPTFVIFVSFCLISSSIYCFNDLRDIDADRVSATRYILESSIQYRFCFVKAENEGTGTWTNYASNEGTVALEDGKTYYGGFYYVNSSTTPKSYFGDNTGFRTWYSEVTTTNTDNSLVPSALSMNWGGSVSNIQSAMNGYNMTTGTSGRAVAQTDGSYMVEYAGKNKENKISYYFTSATTGLFESDVQYSKSAVSSTDILAYLNANYTYLSESEGTYMYVTTDAKTYVLFFTVNDNWNIGFVDVNYVNSSSVKALIPRHVLANRAPRIAPQYTEGERTSKGWSLNVRNPYKEVRNAK